MFEMARQNISDEVRKKAADAKLAYDAAYMRFNTAQNDAMVKLAIFDMTSAMKRYCYIVETMKDSAPPVCESKPSHSTVGKQS